jgi:2-polyprenyl-3-methyl-5-hydroxy-6-metoxy-1,4-benzoquinol methylase
MASGRGRSDLEWSADKVSRTWDYYGDHETHEDIYFSRRYVHHLYSLIRRHVPLREARVLDYGCGPGFLLEELARHDVTCSGLEFSVRTAEKAVNRLKDYASFEGVVVADHLPGKLASDSFDAVTCIEVVEHLTDDLLNPTLREICRLLKPSGVVLLTTPNQEDLGAETVICPDCGRIFHRWQHVRNWSLASIEAAMVAQGFTTRLVRETLFLQSPWSLLSLGRKLYGVLRGYRPHLVYVGIK